MGLPWFGDLSSFTRFLWYPHKKVCCLSHPGERLLFILPPSEGSLLFAAPQEWDSPLFSISWPTRSSLSFYLFKQVSCEGIWNPNRGSSSVLIQVNTMGGFLDLRTPNEVHKNGFEPSRRVLFWLGVVRTPNRFLDEEFKVVQTLLFISWLLFRGKQLKCICSKLDINHIWAPAWGGTIEVLIGLIF